jgi:hypothetical protein
MEDPSVSCVDRESYHGLTAAVRRLLLLAGIVLGLLVISAILGSRAHADEQSATEPESTTDPVGAGLVGGLVDGVANASSESEPPIASLSSATADVAEQSFSAPIDEVEHAITALVESDSDSLAAVVEPVAEPVLEPIVDEVAPVVAPVTEPLTTIVPGAEGSPSQPDGVRPEGRSDFRDQQPQDHVTSTSDSRVQTDRPDAVLELPVNSTVPADPAAIDAWGGGAQTGEVDHWPGTPTAAEDSPAITHSLTTTGVSGTSAAASSSVSVTAVVPESARPADGACGWGPAVRDVFVPKSCALEPETRPG